MNTYLQKKHQLHPSIGKKSVIMQNSYALFQTLFLSLNRKRKVFLQLVKVYMKAKKQQLYDWYSLAKTCHFSLVSSTMYLSLCLYELCFLCFPYILVDKVVVSAILFDKKS